MRTVTFGVIGFGGAGRAHVRRLNGLTGVRVIVVYDPKIATIAAKNESQYENILFTDDWDQFLSSGMDAVTICTPDHTHFYYAKRTVEKGLHTLVEKPMFVSHDECMQMDALLKRKGTVIFGTHHQKRYIPSFAAAKQYIDSGELGDVVLIEVDYMHDMRERATRFDNWRLDPEKPQKVVLGAMSHSFDLMQWIVRSNVQTITSLSGHIGWTEYPDDDTSVTILKYESGTIAKAASTISSGGLQKERLAVYGTKGQIHNNLLIDANGRTRYLSEPTEGLARMQRLNAKLLKLTPMWEYPYTVNEHEKACTTLLSEFVGCVREGTRFSVGFDEVREVIQMCLASLESSRTGQGVDFQEFVSAQTSK
jgi:predicted dehydrogenase